MRNYYKLIVYWVSSAIFAFLFGRPCFGDLASSEPLATLRSSLEWGCCA
jgi:hypothetical protein